MPRISLVLAITFVVGAIACREAGRPGRAGTRTPSGSADAGASPADSGPPEDGSAGPDAGFVFDAGGGPADSGVPLDAGSPDAGAESAVSIYALQDPTRPGRPAVDATVRLRDVVVTAVAARGQLEGSFWVQDPLGGPFSGVLVFRPANVPDPGAQVGDRVSLTGQYIEYFDVTEVVLETLDRLTPGAPLAPQLVPALELANGSPTAEQWEGVFVRIDNVRVLDTMPDAPDDFGEYVVTGGLRIGDDIFALEPRPAEGTVFSRVVGVHHHSFDNYKVLPRLQSDFVP